MPRRVRLAKTLASGSNTTSIAIRAAKRPFYIEANGGFTGGWFRGAPWLVDEHITPTGSQGNLFLLNDDYFNLIINQNVESVQGYGQHLQSLQVIDAYPAQELYRLEDRDEPRDWESRWSAAGGTFYDGRMVALKGDAVWTAISAFQTPWPPYDFNSGMWVKDVDRNDAIALGLMPTTEQGTPKSWNDTLL